jgi:hypothetical protein
MVAMSHWLSRFLLLAALVFSQALYAGHGVVHSNGEQADCHICLQASSGGAALVCDAVALPLPVYAPLDVSVCPVSVSAASPFPTSHPTRAPPLYPV